MTAVSIRRYDQHVAKREGPGAALVGEQRTAPPFARLAVLAGHSRSIQAVQFNWTTPKERLRVTASPKMSSWSIFQSSG